MEHQDHGKLAEREFLLIPEYLFSFFCLDGCFPFSSPRMLRTCFSVHLGTVSVVVGSLSRRNLVVAKKQKSISDFLYLLLCWSDGD